MGVGLTFCYLYVLAMGCVFCCAGALGTSLAISEILFKTQLTKSHGRRSALAALLSWVVLTQLCGEIYLGYIFHFEERFGCTVSAFIFANGGLGCVVATMVTLHFLRRRA